MKGKAALTNSTVSITSWVYYFDMNLNAISQRHCTKKCIINIFDEKLNYDEQK